MFIELVDSLRCPRSHEDTWLVAAVERFHGRHVARGSLGCPVCRAQYRIEEGAVDFTSGGHPGAPPGRSDRSVAGEEVMRARALLDLAEPGGVVALVGAAAGLAAGLEEDRQVALLLVNPAGAVLGPGVSTLWVDEQLPLAAGSLRGAMTGDGHHSPAFMESLVRALKPRGRLVAPSTLELPPGMTELARDDREWVAERTGGQVSAPVALHRAGR